MSNLTSTFLAAAAIVFISSAGAVYAQNDHKHDHSHGHHHHHHAPHDGTLVVLGDEAAHLELVLDSAAGEITGYVLDGEAEKSIRVKQPEVVLDIYGGDVKSTVTLALQGVASPLTGEKPGDTSQFVGKADGLKKAKKFNVVIRDITVKGAPFKNVMSPFPEGNH